MQQTEAMISFTSIRVCVQWASVSAFNTAVQQLLNCCSPAGCGCVFGKRCTVRKNEPLFLGAVVCFSASRVLCSCVLQRVRVCNRKLLRYCTLWCAGLLGIGVLCAVCCVLLCPVQRVYLWVYPLILCRMSCVLGSVAGFRRRFEHSQLVWGSGSVLLCCVCVCVFVRCSLSEIDGILTHNLLLYRAQEDGRSTATPPHTTTTITREIPEAEQERCLAKGGGLFGHHLPGYDRGIAYHIRKKTTCPVRWDSSNRTGDLRLVIGLVLREVLDTDAAT